MYHYYKVFRQMLYLIESKQPGAILDLDAEWCTNLQKCFEANKEHLTGEQLDIGIILIPMLRERTTSGDLAYDIVERATVIASAMGAIYEETPEIENEALWCLFKETYDTVRSLNITIEFPFDINTIRIMAHDEYLANRAENPTAITQKLIN